MEYLQGNVVNVSSYLRSRRVECHGTGLQVANRELLLVDSFFGHAGSNAWKRGFWIVEMDSPGGVCSTAEPDSIRYYSGNVWN